MKILQIHTMYHEYLKAHYAGNPELREAPFASQMEALARDGFSGSHFFALYMATLGYEGRLVIANCITAQHRWLRESGQTLTDPADWVQEITLRQIEHERPDILYLSGSETFNGVFLARLNWRPALTLGFRGTLYPETAKPTDFDVVLSNSARILQQAEALGARATEWFYPAIPEQVMDEVKDEPPCHDVVFIGSWTTAHTTRNGYLRHIARSALASGAFSPSFHLLHSQPLPEEVRTFTQAPKMGREMYRTLKRGRIAFNASIDNDHDGEAGNMRLFEATGVGAFVLTDHQDNLREYFEPGVEVETFRDEHELVDKIHYYLAHPTEREAIARRGQRRCRRDHSMSRRCREFDALVRRNLARKAGGPAGVCV